MVCLILILYLISNSSWVFSLSLWGPFQAYQKQFISPLPSCSTVNNFFFALYQDVSICLSFRFLLIWLRGPSVGTTKSTIWQVLLFLLINSTLGLLVEIKWLVFISKSLRILWISFSRTYSSLCIYHLVVCSNFNLLFNSQWIIFPIRSCLDLCYFWLSLLHSLIKRLTV